MNDLELNLKAFQIVDEIDTRLTVAKNTGQDTYKVKSEIRDELIQLLEGLSNSQKGKE